MNGLVVDIVQGEEGSDVIKVAPLPTDEQEGKVLENWQPEGK